MKLIASTIIVAFLIQYAAAHGKEERHPHLSKETLKQLVPQHPTIAPEVAQTVATCYQGYTLMSDGTCIKEITEEPTPAMGDITVPYITRCPVGFVPRNGECLQSKESPLSFFCPVGFEDDGTSCAQSIPGEVVASCNEGELINGICVSTRRAPHLITPTCPEGSQVEKDGNCWKTLETFDCTPKTGKEEVTGRVIASPRGPVPLGKKILVSKGKGGAKLRALHAQQKKKEVEEVRLPYGHPSKHSVPGKLVAGGKDHSSTSTTTLAPVVTACPKKELVSVTPPHPTRIAPVSQLCAKKVAVDALAIVSCPDGFEDFGEECLKEATTTPVSLCLSNGSTSGSCPPLVRRVRKIPQCLNGNHPVDNRCVDVESAPAENVCADGFRDTGNGCTALVKSGGYECRPGLELVGDRCIGKSVRPSVSVELKAAPGCVNKY